MCELLVCQMIDGQLAASRNRALNSADPWLHREAEAADLTFFVNFCCNNKNETFKRINAAILMSFIC